MTDVIQSVSATVEMPRQLGVIALPGVVLFPGALLPLYIFETRYREMLSDALETNRIFAVASCNSEGILPGVGGAGIIRACISNPDGTSNLILEGLARVRFLEWLPGTSYRLASVENMLNSMPPPGSSSSLRNEIVRLCLRLGSAGAPIPAHFEIALQRCADSAEFSDLVGSTVVDDPLIRQRLLEESDVCRRMEILAAYLTRISEPGA